MPPEAHTPDECPGCGDEFVFGGWGLMHGRTKCGRCGIPMQVLPLSSQSPDDVPYCRLKDYAAEAFADYYDEHGDGPSPDELDEYIEANGYEPEAKA